MKTYRPLPTRRALSSVACVAAACLLAACGTSLAGPENPTVRHGEAAFEANGNHTTITAGNNAVIDYSSFNVAAEESVRFVQPGERARVLNRIFDNSPTQIAGALTANGHVYLVNPAGVYFANGAMIDVGGLTAAAGQMSISDFVNGVDRFTQLDGTVVNEGTIRADSASLLGRQVVNTGTIEAGRVLALVAGDEVQLVEQGGHLRVRVDGTNLGDGSQAAPAESADVGVENTGTLRTGSGGRITLGAGDMYSLAIRNRGQITAEGGQVRVLANDGNVALADGSSISAAGSGAADGGEVVVDAPEGVTFFSEGATIDVSGGEAGGDGGFAEVSGERVDFRGTVRADGDTPGTLLIDPADLYIRTPDDGEAGDGEVLFNEPDTVTDINVAPAVLEAFVGDIFLQANDNLFVKDEVNLVNDNNVTLEALLGDVVFEARFTGADAFTVSAPDGRIVFDIAGLTPLNPGIVSGGQQTYQDPVVLKQDTVLKTTRLGILFRDTVATDPAASAGLWLQTSGVTFEDNVGGADNTTALSLLDVSGDTNFGAKTGVGPDVTVRTVGPQSYRGNVNLYSNAHLISDAGLGGDVHFFGAIDSFREGVALGEEANLLIDVNGLGSAAIFDAFVSKRTLVGSLRVNGTSILNGGRIVTARDQIYNGPTLLTRDNLLVSTRGDVRFLGTLGAYEPLENGARVNRESLAIQQELAPGLIVHAEKVNPFFDPGEFDDPVADERNGDVQFAGDIGGGEELEARALIDSIDNDVIVEPSGGPLRYLYAFSAVNNDNPAVDGDLERGVITFGGNEDPLSLIQVNVLEDIRLNGGGTQTALPRPWNPAQGYVNDLNSVPTIATIASADGDIEFYAGDDFTMGFGNKLTSVNKLSIYAGDDIAIGDLNAFISSVDRLDPISIGVYAGDKITFLNRVDNGVREQDNTLIFDEGIDIVCQRAFEFVGDIQEGAGALPPPRFGTPLLNPDVSGLIGAEGWEIIENVPLTEADFRLPYFFTEALGPGEQNAPLDAGRPVVLDLTIVEPTPPGEEVADDILLAPLPFEDRMVREPLLGPEQRTSLQQGLAVNTRDLTQDELNRFNPGLQQYSDIVPALVPVEPAQQRRVVALNRVRRADAIQALGRYQAMFLASVTDPETGEARLEDRSGRLRQTLAQMWQAYRQQADVPTPGGCRQWLQQAEDRTEAAQLVQQLSELLTQLNQIGLSPVEYEAVVGNVLQAVAPEGMTVEQLRTLITGEQPAPPTAGREAAEPVS